jgi:phage N-6-adenine-methyltransferase
MSNNFQSVTPKGGANTGTDTWLTPQWIIGKIGISDLDPCGYLPSGKPITKTAHHYFTEQQDGLAQEWRGTIFCNPPYSDLKIWLAKCTEYFNKTGLDVIALVFVRSETRAFQENVKFATGINLINKRIKFLNAKGIEQSNGNAPSCLIAWGEKAFSRIKNIDGIYARFEK